MWTEAPRTASGTVYHVDAPAIGDTMEITVIEPFPGAAASGLRFPALYVLDPSATLDIVVGTKRLYDIFCGGALPLTYIVGIGYADPDIGGRRFRDFTPTQAALPAGMNSPLPFGLGGASRYLDFIADTVMPHLEANHPLDPRQRALLGYSLSGRFAVHVLLARPDSFARYLIISPSLWWDDASVFRDEADWAKTHGDLVAKIFLVAGDAEEQPGGGWGNIFSDDVGLPLKQLSNLRELSQRLTDRHYAGLHLKTALIPGGRHITVFPAAVGLGLTELYDL
jgi:predicted alpha/beta superfamily hydrolase